MKPHVCFLTEIYNRRDSLMIYRHGAALVENGYRVTLIVCDDLADETFNGIEIISIGRAVHGRVRRVLDQHSKLAERAYSVDADTYQISETNLIGLGLKLRRKGRCVVFNMRENYFELMKYKSYIPSYLRNAASMTMRLYLNRNLKRFDAVISVTENIDDTVRAAGVRRHFVVKNYPSSHDAPTVSYEDYTKRPDRLCYLGTIYNISCQEEVFDALSRLPDIEYRIAGVFNDGYDDVLKREPYWKRVNFTGRFALNEMADIFMTSTISNILRDFNKTGNPDGSYGIIKMFESMKYALPIICSDVKINREIIAKYNCGICVDPHDREQIYEAVKSLADDKKTAYLMGQNGQRAVSEEYNWENQAKTYLSIFNNLKQKI